MWVCNGTVVLPGTEEDGRKIGAVRGIPKMEGGKVDNHLQVSQERAPGGTLGLTKAMDQLGRAGIVKDILQVFNSITKKEICHKVKEVVAEALGKSMLNPLPKGDVSLRGCRDGDGS